MSAYCGRAIFGDFGMAIFLKKHLRPEIAKGGNLGERLQRKGTKRSRGWSEWVWRKRARKRARIVGNGDGRGSGFVLRTTP